MAYSTGIIKAFDLMFYKPGFIIRYPKKTNLEELANFKEDRNFHKFLWKQKSG